MKREGFKSFDYFIESIKGCENVINKCDDDYFLNFSKEKILTSLRYLCQCCQDIFNCKYSAGFHPLDLKEDLIKAIDYAYESWDGFWLVDGKGGKKLNQYGTGAYDEMIKMLSVGYLLEIPNEDFHKLVEIIDRDGVKDYLFEFIISAKIKDRTPIETESYQKYFGVPDTFKKLRLAIIEKDKAIAENLVKEFARKDWYMNHRSSGWWGSHKLEKGAYTGYWSFETAAVVKIMGLDDSSFKDCQYYPADMVHWKDIPYYVTEIKEEKKGFFGKLFGG